MDTVNAEQPELPVNPKIQWHKYFALLFIAVSVFMAGIGYSSLDPIYPREAANKGIQASQFRFVFGVFQLAYFLSSPVFGAYVKRIGPKLMFGVGVLILSLGTIAFGFVDWVPAGAPFLAVSIVIRIVNGLADSAMCISGYTLAIACHPTHIAFAVSIVHTSYIVGLAVGPTIGSSLYGIGGFRLPFLTSGGILLLFCFISIFVLKPINCEEDSSGSDGPKVAKVIQNPRAFITCFVVFAVTTASGCIQTLLEIPIRLAFNLSESSIGLVFMASTVTYVISSVVWGSLTKKIGHYNTMIIFSLTTTAVGLILIGPVPFTPIRFTMGIVVSSLVVEGIGYGCAMMNVFMELIVIVAGDGPKDLTTKGFASGLFVSTMSLGYFVGPTVAGPLCDLIGFSITSVVMLGLELLAAILVATVVLINRMKPKPEAITQF